jgi:Flp pilus assembly protein TadG
MTRRRETLTRGECGDSLVSFALTVPILFGFVFGLMQVCLALYSHEYISELAREGARYAIVHGPDCLTSSGTSCMVTATTGAGSFPSVNSYVSQSALPNLGGGKITVNTTYPSGEVVNQPVRVNVSCAFPFNILFVTSTTLTMSSTSEMYIIQ